MAEIKSDLVAKIETLKETKQGLLVKKEMLDKQLADLDKEIEAKGFDPANLPGKISELTKLISDFEKKATPVVDSIIAKLSSVNNSEHSAEEFPGFESKNSPSGGFVDFES